MAHCKKEALHSEITDIKPTGCMVTANQRSSAIASDDEKRNSSDSDFINKMSHDFYTPLNIIIGFAELMLEEIPGTINEQQRSSLTDILDSGKRLLALVDELMAKFKTESGRMA